MSFPSFRVSTFLFLGPLGLIEILYVRVGACFITIFVFCVFSLCFFMFFFFHGNDSDIIPRRTGPLFATSLHDSRSEYTGLIFFDGAVHLPYLLKKSSMR